MIMQIVDNVIKTEQTESYLKAAAAFAKDAANDEGCHGMQGYLDEQKKDHVYIVSYWENEEAMKASTTFAKHKADMKPAFLRNETTILRSL